MIYNLCIFISYVSHSRIHHILFQSLSVLVSFAVHDDVDWQDGIGRWDEE